MLVSIFSTIGYARGARTMSWPMAIHSWKATLSGLNVPRLCTRP